MTKIKYTELLDMIVRVLKEARMMDANGFISLTAFLNLIKYNHSFNDAIEIGKYMETIGWAKASYLIGDVRLQITPNGMLYIEQKGNDFEKFYANYTKEVLSQYPENKRPFIQLLDEKNNIDPKATIFEIITNMKSKVENTNPNSDFLKDVEVIKIEISKTNPDLRMIEVKLNSLAGISQISDEVSQLKDYVQIHQHF